MFNFHNADGVGEAVAFSCCGEVTRAAMKTVAAVTTKGKRVRATKNLPVEYSRS
jgi:hypothetical protein